MSLIFDPNGWVYNLTYFLLVIGFTYFYTAITFNPTKISEDNLLAKKNIWLPEGQWYELSTGSMLAGGKVVERAYAINEMPVFVKSGSILPMYEDIDHLQEEVNHWVIKVIPGKQGETTVYDDDGASTDYLSGASMSTELHQVSLDWGKQITISPSKGKYRLKNKKR